MPDTDLVVARPQPVTSAGNIAGAVSGIASALGTIAVVAGMVTQTDADTVVTAITVLVGAVVTLITVLAPILKARQARDVVTPLVDPRTVDGVALVPVAPPPVLLPPHDAAGPTPATS